MNALTFVALLNTSAIVIAIYVVTTYDLPDIGIVMVWTAMCLLVLQVIFNARHK